MDEWCDDFSIKVGDHVPPPGWGRASHTAPNLPQVELYEPEVLQPNKSWNDWTSTTVCRDPWLTDPKVRFAPNLASDDYTHTSAPTTEKEQKIYPQPSDDTGDALNYIDTTIETDIPSQTNYIYDNSGVDDKHYNIFSNTIKYSKAYVGETTMSSTYIDVLDVFNHITLGGRLSDEYIDCFCKYVYNSDPDFKKREVVRRQFTNINGVRFTRCIVMYTREDYLKVVVACADWARFNPEKVVIV